jgi:hypothetical protein
MVRINKREQELRDLVHGVAQTVPLPVLTETPQKEKEKPMTQYI